MSTYPSATITGYPRIGRNRELKRALEDVWAGRINELELIERARALRSTFRKRLSELGLDARSSAIPADFSYYDQVLSAMATFGALPKRFAEPLGDAPLDLTTIFTVARGEGERPALEMTKWFDSNYHYLVPEISPSTRLAYTSRHVAGYVKESIDEGIAARPVVVGPVTFLLLSKVDTDADVPEGFRPIDRIDELTQAYCDLLGDLAKAGAQWVQIDEPALVADTWDIERDALIEIVQRTYATLVKVASRPSISVALTYGEAHDCAAALAKTGVEGIVLDLVRGSIPNPETLKLFGDCGTAVAAGVVSGRNVWRTDLQGALATLQQVNKGIQEGAHAVPISVTTSTSLQHVPYDVEREEALDPQIKSWLAFADQKVTECVVLAQALAAGGVESSSDIVKQAFAADEQSRKARAAHPGVKVDAVRQAINAITDEDRQRIPYAQRRKAQLEALSLPLLPTTTIGSFPQTAEIRKARAAHRAGKLDDAGYKQAMKDEIKSVVELQEKLDLDVLVHGEAERNDMVQYFAENLDGFVTTTHGWVQSYGSRCTRPSILWGDVSRPAPITVEWSTYAQSLTKRPMKGMLTGPVTILAWSFVRDDIAWGQVADQVGLALREEVIDLADNGIGIIQVDEPALRELLPLRRAQRDAYLKESVGAFLLATSGADDATQIHTHLCYSDFNIVIDAIDHLDADVTLIEASRSKMEILPAVGRHGFERQIGPGVWDIHSPRVPSVQECRELLEAAVAGVGADKVWANPDCGLKTRAYQETVASLKNLVEAAHQVRDSVDK
ncbi:MAG: 5-methyltetrahydropteroyltriglutamate--homocysteine S-methyltransferase [Actinomycetaceae bacterium]|nr:5-methyltetrahydropteroyltriglutamate--homocysteine S-methyltransferase [Actinomycetaceae bacterium]